MQENIISEKNTSNLFKRKFFKIWSLLGFEALVWILGLFYLAFVHSPGITHFTICPLANLGIEFCPGCGLGNSISYLLKGEIISSFYAHPLGFLAALILIFRIFTIIKNNRRRYA